MRKLISHMHLSLDGYAAGPSGEMDWIHLGEDLFDFVHTLTEKADAALYGRVTWNMMEAYWPEAASKPGATKHDREHSAWYSRVDKYVLSNTLRETRSPNTTILGGDVAGQVAALKQREGKDILMLGSPGALRSLIPAGLVDAYWFFVNPVVVGGGIPVFPALPKPLLLEHRDAMTFRSGVTAIYLSAESRK